jgi:sulfate transport system ATP-binding protein
MSIEVKGVTKKFGDFNALGGVNLDIHTGELVALLGPSGSGKTTLLRIIAGLETPDSGSVIFHGNDATDQPTQDRQVGFVFQHYALFRHMTVAENIAFGLRVRPRKLRPNNAEIKNRVTNLLQLVQLEGLAERYPSELSGGQRQRVALARALAVEPKVLLLDEPFGALDARVRQELRRRLRKLHDELGVTTVFVTHDQEEALEVSDRVVVLNKGHIEQIGTPDEVYLEPKNAFVLNFLGNVNRFRGRADHGQVRIGDLTLDAPEHAALVDAPVSGFVRPHDIDITRHHNGDSASLIPATVTFIASLGPFVRVELERENGEPLDALLTRERYEELSLQSGEPVFIRARRLRVFADDVKPGGEDYSI